MPLSQRDFRQWYKHTPEEWQQWVAELPPAGHWSYSWAEWREWLQMMVAIQKDIDAAPVRAEKRQSERKKETPVTSTITALSPS